ncbi:unnamed protein product [Rhizophagus irregularis]|nr:unnamed protein product [Rhizophagus irregularis]
MVVHPIETRCKDNNAKEDVKRLNKINLTNNEWDIIRDLLEIFGPLAELTEILEGTKYATMSYIYPGIIKLKSMFSPTINSNLDLETNDDAFENHQFEEVDEDDEPDARGTYCSLLDPRKKKTMFASNDQKELAKANLREVYELAKNDTNIHLEECEPKPKKRKTSTRVYKRRLFSDDESHDLQTEDNEVGRYLVMAQIKNDQDPLNATSGASERVFSDAGLIMSSKRTSMKEDLFEALIFLKRNGDLVGVGEMFS